MAFRLGRSGTTATDIEKEVKGVRVAAEFGCYRELDSDYFKRDLVVGSVTDIGQTQYTMLSGLVDAPISREIGKRLDEWERKFQRKISFERDSGRGGYVGSPLPDMIAGDFNLAPGAIDAPKNRTSPAPVSPSLRIHGHSD